VQLGSVLRCWLTTENKRHQQSLSIWLGARRTCASQTVGAAQNPHLRMIFGLFTAAIWRWGVGGGAAGLTFVRLISRLLLFPPCVPPGKFSFYFHSPFLVLKYEMSEDSARRWQVGSGPVLRQVLSLVCSHGHHGSPKTEEDPSDHLEMQTLYTDMNEHELQELDSQEPLAPSKCHVENESTRNPA
jgi:hypothetical protein